MTKQALQQTRAQRLLRLHGVLYASALAAMLLMMVLFRLSLPPYVLFAPVLWGFALLGHWLLVSQMAGTTPSVERTWEQLYAPRAQANYGDDPLDALRREVDAELPRELRRRRAAYLRYSIASVITGILLSWLIIPILFGPFAVSGESVLLSLLTLSLSGATSVALQRQTVLLDLPEAQRKLQQELLARLLLEGWDEREKPKRHAHLEDDGEIGVDDLMVEDGESRVMRG